LIPAGVVRSVLETMTGAELPSLRFRVARLTEISQLNKST
jgi:hypothetical protein